MIKKTICAAVITASIFTFASCSCLSGAEETRPPESKAVNLKTSTGEYASFVTAYKWINDKTGDTLKFNSNGTFNGKLDKKSYSGTFTLKADKNKTGVVYSDVTLEGKKKSHIWTFKFKDSAHMTLTTNDNASESYAAEWTIENKENNAE